MEQTSFKIPFLGNNNEYRGLFITEFSRLERVVDLYLAKYFTKDEHNANELISILIDRISFEGKATALKALFERKNTFDEFMNNRHDKKTYKKITDGLRSVAQKRNWFAHYHLLDVVHDQSIVIGLIQFRDSTNLITYNHKQFENLIAEILNLKNQIINLLNELVQNEDLSNLY